MTGITSHRSTGMAEGLAVGVAGGMAGGVIHGTAMAAVTRTPRIIPILGVSGALVFGSTGLMAGAMLGDVGAPTLGLASGAVTGATLGAIGPGSGRQRLAGAVLTATLHGATGWVAGRAMD